MKIGLFLTPEQHRNFYKYYYKYVPTESHTYKELHVSPISVFLLFS